MFQNLSNPFASMSRDSNGQTALDASDWIQCNRRMFLRILICLLSVAPALAQTQNQTPLVPKGLLRLGTGAYFSPYALVVDKKARMLTVWKQEGPKLLKALEFPSDMGKNSGDKAAAGDFKTPEGIYFLQKLLEGPTLPFDLYGVRAFTMDYPNVFDRRSGKHGSGIWLHAIPDKVSLERGSRGCVVVRNEAILELSKYITPEKTPIIVYDSVPYAQEDERQKSVREVEEWMTRWLTAWKSKKLDDYMTYYSKEFAGNKMNWDQWRKHKAGLNETYQNIEVELYNPVIYEHGEGWVIRSLQAYRSDKHEDFGEKSLYLQSEDGQLKIIEESWAPVQQGTVQNLAKCCETTTSAANN
jgi:murein L,D-transpeptidase YafK